MIIIKVQESCIHLFLINHLVNNWIFISPKNVIFLKTSDSEFLYIEVWFNDQNSKPLKIEDKC